jgi:hypothetical protein
MRHEKRLAEVILSSVSHVTDTPAFKQSVLREKSLKEGMAALNNSFLFREELGTQKNARYLCIPFGPAAELLLEKICIGQNLKFNDDFKFFSNKTKPGDLEGLYDSLPKAVSAFGKLPYILIGNIRDDVEVEVPFESGPFKRLVLSPSQTQTLTVKKETISIKDANDEEALWLDFELGAAEAYQAEGSLPIDLAAKFAKALDKLRAQAYAIVNLPTGGAESRKGNLLDSIVSVLISQIGEYEKSLSRCHGEPAKGPDDFNNILRISYNFSSDASKILQLLTSMCDLKPVLFWCTVAEWFELSHSFHRLPWSKSENKASLKAYRSVIGSARNRSFHNLFSFSKTLKVPLAGVPLGAIELTFFSEFSGRKNANHFEYEDQALVDAFVEFTRAGERFVPSSFWAQNLEVMKRTVDLLKSLGSALHFIALAATS